MRYVYEAELDKGGGKGAICTTTREPVPSRHDGEGIKLQERTVNKINGLALHSKNRNCEGEESGGRTLFHPFKIAPIVCLCVV